MVCSAILLKPNVANFILFNFCEQKFVQHGPITIAIDCNNLSLIIFEEKCPNYDQNQQQTVTCFGCVGFSMYTSGFSVPQIRKFWLFTYPPRSKWASSEKIIFLPQLAFCKSTAGSLSEVYTQPYTFGGRIKLIICHIRHELSVTIHEISTSWKESVRWRTQYNVDYQTKIFEKFFMAIFLFQAHYWGEYCFQTIKHSQNSHIF